MATLKVESLPREFYFNGTRIRTLPPQMTAEEIRDCSRVLSGNRHRHIDRTGGYRQRASLLLQPRHRLEG